MGFLRRVRGGDAITTATVWATTPDWAAPIAPEDFKRLASLVQHELGRERIPDPAMLRDFANAAELSLPNLVPVLVKIPVSKWPGLMHEFLTATRKNRELGDALEARSQTLAAASTVLRIDWMPEASRPLGDVMIKGPIPDTVEVLALDTGPSLRHVSERLFARWGVSVDEAVRVARERVLALPLGRGDRASAGHPDVRVLSLEAEGPYAGALLWGLERAEPAAIGPFGTLVGVPDPSALLVRALAPSASLRGDLADLALCTGALVAQGKGSGFLDLPLWRRPDGRVSKVAFRFSKDGEVTDSYHPGFAGVLAALDPREWLPVPGWALEILDKEAYTRFAGCVSAACDARPEEVARLASAYSLAYLATRCHDQPFEIWPALAAEHIREMAADLSAAAAVGARATDDPTSVLEQLVVWLAPSEAEAGEVRRPLDRTGFDEVLGTHAAGAATPLKASVAAALGPVDRLFARGSDAVRRGLSVTPSSGRFLSGNASVITGFPSPTAVIPHLVEWCPDAVGAFGALVSVGSASQLLVLPIEDASVVLDLPMLIGSAAIASDGAEWRLPPTVFWAAPGRLEAIHVSASEGIITGVSSTTDLATLVARLPADPVRMPPGLEEILGRDGARRFYGLLHAELLARIVRDAGDVAGLNIPGIRGMAAACADTAPAGWPALIFRSLDEMAAPRRELDRVTLATDYQVAAPALGLEVVRDTDAAGQLVRTVGGGLAVYPTIRSGLRYRAVTFAMLGRWGVDVDRVMGDAGTKIAHDPSLIDEPMFADQPAVRQLYSTEGEREVAALYLHLRYPGSRRGFVVSVTHGSRAHYVRLDDPGATTTIPVFAALMADIYRRADAAADAHSPWLLWLTPDGRIVELFDTLKPTPPAKQLPAEFVAMLAEGQPSRPN